MKQKKYIQILNMLRINSQANNDVNPGKVKIMLLYFILVMGIITFFSSCKRDNPEADFTASAESVAIGDTVYFTNHSSNASYYQWTFGDGDAAVTKDASHVFTEAGTYQVTLVSIGKNKSNSISKNILVTGKVSIYEGVGISEVSLGDTWATIKNKFSGEDTLHYVDSSDLYYYHLIYYYTKGIAIYISNFNDSVVNDNDEAFEIIVSNPYEGYTKKGITIGDDIQKVKSTYGTPSVYDGSNYYVYYYSKLGIEFWTSSTSSAVENIAVYASNSNSSSSTQNNKSKCLPVLHNLRGRLEQAKRTLK